VLSRLLPPQHPARGPGELLRILSTPAQPGLMPPGYRQATLESVRPPEAGCSNATRGRRRRERAADRAFSETAGLRTRVTGPCPPAPVSSRAAGRPHPAAGRFSDTPCDHNAGGATTPALRQAVVSRLAWDNYVRSPRHERLKVSAIEGQQRVYSGGLRAGDDHRVIDATTSDVSIGDARVEASIRLRITRDRLRRVISQVRFQQRSSNS
jgi:hypothetical protein